MDKKLEEEINQLYYALVRERAEQQFKNFLDCAPSYIKSAVDKSEKLKHNIFMIFFAGFFKGFHEFESMEDLEKERNNKIK